MKQNEIDELNKALKGENMAIEGFDHYIQDIRDEDLKKRLQDMQERHKFHAIELSERIQKLGGNPVNTSGVPGIMSEVRYKISPQKYMNNSIIETALHGERLGIEAYGDIKSRLHEETNKQLVESMMVDTVKIVEELNRYV